MKKFLSLILALVLCMGMASVTLSAKADEESYELVWLRYGQRGTTDAQSGLVEVQAAVNDWLKENGYNFTVDMTQIEDMSTLQVEMAAKDRMDIVWRNASDLSDTLIRGNFLYNIADLYKNYEGLYSSIPENVWNTLLRENGTALYLIPTYKECGLAVYASVPVSVCERFGWDEILNDDHTKVWSVEELTPYIEEAMATGDFEVAYHYNTLFQGNREHDLLDSIAAVNSFIGVDLESEGNQQAALTPDIPAYQNYVSLMNSWNAAGYVNEAYATGGINDEMEHLFYPEAATPDHQAQINSKQWLQKDGNGAVYIRLTDTYLNSTSALGSAFGFASYTEHIDYCLEFMDALYSKTELADLCLYGIEGVHYNRAEDGRCERIDDSGYRFDAWSCANVMVPSLSTTDSVDKKEKYAAFNENAKPSLLMGFVFDSADVSAEVLACNAVVSEYQSLLEKGFLGEDGLSDYRDALVAAGAEKVLAEVNNQLADFFAAQ